jgi:WD40 repeat protein
MVWDWRSTTQVAGNKISSSKVYSIAFSEDGNFFVTCGQKHLKYWNMDNLGVIKKSDKVYYSLI